MAKSLVPAEHRPSGHPLHVMRPHVASARVKGTRVFWGGPAFVEAVVGMWAVVPHCREHGSGLTGLCNIVVSRGCGEVMGLLCELSLRDVSSHCLQSTCQVYRCPVLKLKSAHPPPRCPGRRPSQCYQQPQGYKGYTMKAPSDQHFAAVGWFRFAAVCTSSFCHCSSKGLF